MRPWLERGTRDEKRVVVVHGGKEDTEGRGTKGALSRTISTAHFPMLVAHNSDPVQLGSLPNVQDYPLYGLPRPAHDDTRLQTILQTYLTRTRDFPTCFFSPMMDKLPNNVNKRIYEF